MTSESAIMEGGCGCGIVRYRVTGTPQWASHCHCRDCRHATGAPYVTYVGLLAPQVAWRGQAPVRYPSSPGVTRSFCGKCGTPLTYEGDRWPGELHILAATLDDPGLITPQAHVYVGQKLPWVQLSDGLPRFGTLPREGPALTD